MNHFSAEQWFEFACRMVSSPQRALMDEHLTEGCDRCRNLSVMWTGVIQINRRESNYHPPASVVQFAKASFKTEERWKWLPHVAQLARLLFDSICEPTPVAVRGPGTSSRQVLQEAKPFVVDLRVDYEPRRKWVRLIGQVLNSLEPDNDVTGIDIFLLKGEHLAASTKANSSGEFTLEFQEEEGLQLFVDIRGRKVIEIQLPTSLEGVRGIAAGAE